ncbi:hypothetical protein ACFYUY_23295 [Kitasatospora sp. NPDC004745]|uniref:hypothetical protein n=1 Tax=Kitasatospora sp. NPDC004745 TaxID=3364019 RepID=UPI003678C203
MTATDAAPDATAEDRWQHIQDRLTAIERRIREHSTAAIATVEACLARLDTLRHDLAHRPWPPQSSPAPAAPPSLPPQPARAPTADPFDTAGRRRTRTVADAPQQDNPANNHQATGRVPA